MVAVAVVAVVRAMRRPRTTREHLLRACSTGGPIGCHLLATFCLTFRAGSQRFAEVLKGWPKVRKGLQRIPQGCWLHAGSLPGPSMYVRGHDGMRGATPTVALMAAAMHNYGGGFGSGGGGRYGGSSGTGGGNGGGSSGGGGTGDAEAADDT